MPPGCKAILRSTAAFESHYAAVHVNVCSECGRTMPTCRCLFFCLFVVLPQGVRVLILSAGWSVVSERLHLLSCVAFC